LLLPPLLCCRLLELELAAGLTVCLLSVLAGAVLCVAGLLFSVLAGVTLCVAGLLLSVLAGAVLCVADLLLSVLAGVVLCVAGLLLSVLAGAVLCVADLLLSVLVGVVLCVAVLLRSVPDELALRTVSRVFVLELVRVEVEPEELRELVPCRVLVPEADRLRSYSVLIRSLSR
jgi:hypothetical protein